MSWGCRGHGMRKLSIQPSPASLSFQLNYIFYRQRVFMILGNSCGGLCWGLFCQTIWRSQQGIFWPVLHVINKTFTYQAFSYFIFLPDKSRNCWTTPILPVWRQLLKLKTPYIMRVDLNWQNILEWINWFRQLIT